MEEKIAEKQKFSLEKLSIETLVKNVNMIFAMSVAVFPFLMFILGLFSTPYFNYMFNFWTIIYAVIFLSFIPTNFKIIKNAVSKNKFSLFLMIFALVMMANVIISAIATKTFNFNTVQIFGYFLLFFVVVTLEPKHRKIFVQILLASLVFSAFCSIIDPHAQFVPGISKGIQMASFFYHANYSANIIGVATVVVVNLMLNEKKKGMVALYAVYFVIFSVFLFMNASFAGITAVFFAFFIEFVVLWIKTKKFPWRLLLCVLAFAVVSLLLELVPNIHDITTCKYNYFIEAIAAFDNVFKTNLLGALTNIESVPGADGWSRDELIVESINAVIGNNGMSFGERLKNILFGLGGGQLHVLRPHNMIVGLWVDFGFIFMALHEILIVCMLVYMVKNAKEKSKTRPFFYAALAYLFVTIFGSMIVYHYIYFVIVLALGINGMSEEESK